MMVALNPEEALERLETLKHTNPDIADLVAGYAGRERNVDSFLRTMAPQTDYVIDTLKPGERLGVWELEGMLGRGGMGAVYKARRADGLYEQSAALKVVQISSDAQRARFDQERQRLARLEHPGVVRIIDGGITDEDLAFLVMEYVDGAPLDVWLLDQTAGREQVLRFALSAAHAISHVHGRLILHRDIKPANILVSKEGQVKLIDFGIGSEFRDADDAPFAMTLAFAAPEQLNQQSVNVGSDIFAFGATLHKLLTGTMPVRRSDGGVDIDKALLKDKELVAIIARATAFDPSGRYGAVDGLIEDLQHYLNKEPVDAYSTARVYRIGKFFSRYPASSALAASLLVALIGGLGASLYSADQVQRALVRAENALERERLAKVSEEAFTDTLMRLFNDQVGEDVMTSILLQHADRAYDYREQDPERAAMTAFAVGRSLVFRSDNHNAINVLENWIEGGYGPERLVWQGKIDLGYAYNNIGKTEKALGIFRGAQDYFSSISDFPYYEQVLTAYEIATITRDPDDYQSAIELATNALMTAPDGNERAYYYTVLDVSYTRLGRFDEAAEYASKGLEFLIATPLLNKHRLTVSRANVASLDIYHTRDYDRARRVLNANIEDEETSLVDRAQSLMLLGNLENELESYKDAKIAFENALSLYQTAEGGDSFSSIAVESDLVENALLSGEIVKAKQRLDDIEDRFNGAPPSHPRLVIAQAHFLALSDSHEAALAYLKDKGVTPAMARVSPVGTHRMDRFRAMGLDVDSLDQPVQPSDGETK